MWVYLNGSYIKAEDAKISPLDRSATFGDGIYEVIPSYDQELFLFHEHFERLKSSLNKTFISSPQELEDLENILKLLHKKNLHKNQSFYIQVSRGVQAVRSHAADKDLQSSLFITSQELEPNPYKSQPNLKGLTTRLEEDIRWQRCDIKTTALIGNILSSHNPTLNPVDEVIFHKEGLINEGSKSNLFMVKKGIVFTPPLSNKILPGVTRQYLLDKLLSEGIDVFEQDIYIQELYSADEVWLTSSTKEVQPVHSIDDFILPSKDPEESLWHRALEFF